MKYQAKLQLEGRYPFIHRVSLDNKDDYAIMEACKKYRASLKDCKIVKDPKDKTIYVFIDNKTVIRAYFWFI